MQIPKHLRWEKHAGGIYLFAEYRYLKPEDIQPLLDSTLHYIANSVKVEQPCLHVSMSLMWKAQVLRHEVSFSLPVLPRRSDPF